MSASSTSVTTARAAREQLLSSSTASARPWVVRVAHDDQPGALVDGAQDGARAVARHGHCVAVRAPRHERIERIRRPRRDQLVARLEQRGRGRRQQLGGAVADDDLVAADAVAVRDLGAQRARVRVDVAVQPAPRGERDRVDDEVVREPGPRRPREIERIDARELVRPPLVGLLAQLAPTSSSTSPGTGGSSRAAPRRPSRTARSRPGPGDEQEPDRERGDADDGRDGEHRADHALALVVARGAAHEDPELVEALEQR